MIVLLRKIILSGLILLFLSSVIFSQEVYQNVSNKSIYSFLDEMANEGYTELNTAIKPWSRHFIAFKLAELDKGSFPLTQRQKAELEFYLRDYSKELLPDKNFKKRFDLLYYKDSLFTFSVNPILGIQYWHNNNGSNYHRWNGIEVFAYAGKHLDVYANLRDNHDQKLLSGPEYLNTIQGAVYKSGNDFSEMRGGITYSWKWGSIGLIKDHTEWGNYYHYPSIISGKVPSVTQVKLVMKPARWFEFNYFHGWLVSGVVDSLASYSYTNSYGYNTRIVYRKKYMAANLFTFKPFKRFYASVGNSIVYSDTDVQPGYLVPFFLYKSLDHTYNNASGNEGGQNSQFFLDISSRQINHLHLYGTLFFDDISITRLKENGHLDYYSLNTGFRLSNLLPDVFLTFEYFQSYPLVYKHILPTTTYESNFYNLGHYLQDNSRGFYTEIVYKPLRGLDIKLYYNFAQHGPDHEELGTPRLDVVNLFLDSVEWQQQQVGLDVQYQVVHDVYIFAGYEYRHVKGNMEKYTAPFYHGTTHTLSVGVNYGF